MKLAPLFALLIANALGTCAFAADLPTGGRVAAGTAGIAIGANSLVITQGSNRAIINWSSFSVGAGNTVQFVQPSTSSAVLNRVIAANPSLIYGSITANGQVFLVNPSGITVGPSGTIQAAGISLSTGNIGDADFLADSIRFELPPTDSTVNVQGQLTASDRIAISGFRVEFSDARLLANALQIGYKGAINAVGTDYSANVLHVYRLGGPLIAYGEVVSPYAVNLSELAVYGSAGGQLTLPGGPSSTGNPSIGSGSATSIVGTLPGDNLTLTGGSVAVTGSNTGAGSITIGSGNIAIAGSSSGGSLSLTSGKLAVPADARKLLQRTAGSIALRGAPSIQASAPTPSPASTPPALRASAPAARLVNTGGLVDGAVTVRLSLVDAAPISLR